MDRYARQTAFKGLGREGQQRLSSGRALLVGCGGLGCIIAGLLVRAGIGSILIADHDRVEKSNLHRQILYTREDAQKKRYKAEAAQARLKKINSTTIVEAKVARANSDNIRKLAKDAHIILDGADTLETKLMLNHAALALDIPLVYGAAAAGSGCIMTIVPALTPCLRCLYPHPGDHAADNLSTMGILGPAATATGSFQAMEAIKWLSGGRDRKSISPYFIDMDIWTGETDRIRVQKNPDCPECGKKNRMSQESNDR